MLSAVAHEEDTATISDENAQNLKEKTNTPLTPPKTNKQTKPQNKHPNKLF